MWTDNYVEGKIKDAVVYNNIPTIDVRTKGYKTKYILEDRDVISSMFSHYSPGEHCAVLNHMCYKEPAPYFLKGVRGREEDLCRYSALFNILRGCKGFYKYNKSHKNRGLCENRALYIPKLEFTKDDFLAVYSVIGAQAPDWKHCGLQYHMFTEDENLSALTERINLILGITFDKSVDILILGDFGCNVYGQSPEVVAGIFKNLLEGTYRGCFKKIIFPIESEKNRTAFSTLFTNN